MRLEVGQNIDNTHVRLNFRKGSYQPDYMPSYAIKTSKADEFVSKFNEQSSNLKKVTVLSVIISSLFVGIIGSNMKGKFWMPIGILSGIFAGFGIGAAISSNKKNKLMDEYGVKRFDGNKK